MNSKRIAIFVLFVSLVTAVLLLSPNSFAPEVRAEPSTLLPQPYVYMVKNIDNSTLSSYPRCRVDAGDFMLCTAEDGIHGRELWRSDGTQAGSSLVKDINDGEEGSDPFVPAARLGDLFFFSADDGEHGDELWKTDGTKQGTRQVKDINPGTDNSYPGHFIAMGGNMFFSASDEGGTNAPGDRELWITDGTAAGTKMVREINPDGGANPVLLTEMGNMLYFWATDGQNGPALWRSDGTETGTEMVIDVDPRDDEIWRYSYRKKLGDTLIFTVDDGIHGGELWKSDGTPGGTELVKDIYPGAGSSRIDSVVEMDDILYFMAYDGAKHDLWRSDGTEAGTILVKEGPVAELFAADDRLFYFTEHDLSPDEGYPITLWVSDGSEAGSIQVLNFGLLDFCDMDADLYAQTSNNNLFFCMLDYDKAREELWTSDGTPSGTYPLEATGPGYSYPYPNMTFAGQFYFSARGRDGNELWTSDGTGPGTVQAVDYNTIEGEGSSIQFIGPAVNNGSQVILRARNPEVGSEPMLSDGTEAGTAVLKDIRPGLYGSGGYNFEDLSPVVLADGQILFAADDGEHGAEMWASDGTEAGTELLVDARPRSGSGIPLEDFDLAATENRAFFLINNSDSQQEPTSVWISDGTPEGTRKVAYEPEGIEQLAATSRYVFYVTGDRQLWSMKETALVPEFLSDNISDSSKLKPTVVKDTLYFKRYIRDEPSYLWKSDGTLAGTESFLQAKVTALYATGDVLYFVVWEGIGKTALWVTDGTQNGTSLVRGGWGEGAHEPHEFTAAGEVDFFRVRDEQGSSLWRTDGTLQGTKKVKTFEPGCQHQMAALHDLLFLVAYDSVHGCELWVSDGTEEGTLMVADINPFPGKGSRIAHLFARGDMLFFAADDGRHGIELWALNPYVGRYKCFLPSVQRQ